MITRRFKVLFIFVVLVCIAVAAFPQRRKQATGPRAVAVIEATPKGVILIPVSFMLDGRFYDATLYHANPVPMALDPGNVYEVQRSGDPVGDFTIQNAEQWPNGAWVGLGTWLSNEERQRREEARAKARAKPAPKPSDEEDEGPPKLTRGKKQEAAPAPETSAPSPQSPAKAEPSQPQDTEDSDHPVLRRGKPQEEQAARLGGNEAGRAVSSPTATAKLVPGFEQARVAVSDATNTESRPYSWKWANAEEEQKIRASMQDLALAAVRTYAAKNGGPAPSSLENIDIRAFDLEYSNSADVVLSARVRPIVAATKKGSPKASTPANLPGDFAYYVTVVAHEDIYAQLDKSLTVVTDNHHLDAFPRMQLIDVVDADGNGSGDLLFRRTSDLGSSFVLYRVNASRLEEILRVPEPKLE